MISQYRKGTGINMINFEEELKNFKPSLEVEEAEQAIYNHELTDMTDVMQEMLQELKQQNREQVDHMHSGMTDREVFHEML